MDKRQDYINHNHKFYLMGYRKLLTVAFVLLFFVLILLALIVYQNYARTLPNYFVTTIDGRLVEIKPIEQ